MQPIRLKLEINGALAHRMQSLLPTSKITQSNHNHQVPAVVEILNFNAFHLNRLLNK